VELGASVNATTKRGWTPLHAAATRGHTCTVIRLVALGAEHIYLTKTRIHTHTHTHTHTHIGANVDPRDVNLRSPLHMAARWGRSQTAEALLTLGADVMAKDCDGLSPVDHAWYYKVHLHYICTLYIILQDV